MFEKQTQGSIVGQLSRERRRAYRKRTQPDWAGCRRTRRGTTGGYTVAGSHIIKLWCKTQVVVALSSAEAEMYGSVSAETMGLILTFEDLGTHMRMDWSWAIRAQLSPSCPTRVGHIEASGHQLLVDPRDQVVAGPGSRRGQKYVSASDEIANEGEQRLPIVSNDGFVKEQKWQLAAVTRPRALARRVTLATVWCLVVAEESSRNYTPAR